MQRQIVLLALLGLVLVAGPAPSALAKGSKGAAPAAAKPTHDEECASLLQTLAKTRDAQTDDEALASIKKLDGYWKDATVTAETKKPVSGLVAWYAKRKSAVVAKAAIVALGDMGRGPCAIQLMNLVEGMLLQKDPPADLLAAAFAALKVAADPDPSVTGSLLNLLQNRDKNVVAKAIEVIAAYGPGAAAVRSHLFELSLTAFETMAAVAAKGTDKDAADKWTLVGAPAVSALSALSHKDLADISAARKWYVDHGHDIDAWK